MSCDFFCLKIFDFGKSNKLSLHFPFINFWCKVSKNNSCNGLYAPPLAIWFSNKYHLLGCKSKLVIGEEKRRIGSNRDPRNIRVDVLLQLLEKYTESTNIMFLDKLLTSEAKKVSDDPMINRTIKIP